MNARAWLRPLTCLKLPTATRRVLLRVDREAVHLDLAGAAVELVRDRGPDVLRVATGVGVESQQSLGERAAHDQAATDHLDLGDPSGRERRLEVRVDGTGRRVELREGRTGNAADGRELPTDVDRVDRCVGWPRRYRSGPGLKDVEIAPVALSKEQVDAMELRGAGGVLDPVELAADIDARRPSWRSRARRCARQLGVVDEVGRGVDRVLRHHGGLGTRSVCGRAEWTDGERQRTDSSHRGH